MAFDPKLRAAMHEIEAVCRKYDCGGHVSLVSRTHGEFRFVLPDWVGMRLIGGGKGWHVKVHTKSNHEEAELTTHFIYSIFDTCGNALLALDKLKKTIEERIKVDHVPFAEYEPNDD